MPAAPAIAAAAAVASTTYAVYSGERAKKDQRKAQQQAERQAEKHVRAAEKAADQEANRSRRNPANAGALLDQAAQAGRTGPSGTMLTGAQGIDQSQLTLDRTTLLGG